MSNFSLTNTTTNNSTKPFVKTDYLKNLLGTDEDDAPDSPVDMDALAASDINATSSNSTGVNKPNNGNKTNADADDALFGGGDSGDAFKGSLMSMMKNMKKGNNV